MGMKIGEFFVGLGVDLDNKDNAKLNDFIRAMGNLDLKSISAIAGLSSVFLILKKVTDQTIRAGMSLSNFNIETGHSTQKLQQWSFIAEQVGASAGDIESAVKSLSYATAQIKLGQGNIAPFQMLGISPDQDPFKILLKIRERIKGLDPSMTRLILSQLGLSESMLLVLNASDDQIDTIKKQYYLNEKQIIQVREMRRVWVELRQGLFFFMNTVGTFLSPTFKNIGLFLKDVVGGISLVVEKLKPFKFAVFGIAIVIGAVFFPVQTIILGVIALIDDLYTHMRGGQALFSPVYEFFVHAFTMISESIRSTKKDLQDLFDIMDSKNPIELIKRAREKVNSMVGNIDLHHKLISGFNPAVMTMGMFNNMGKAASNYSLEINVNGSGDPVSVVDKIKQEVGKFLRNAAYQSEQDNR